MIFFHHLKAHKEWGLLVLRVVIGIIFVYHGYLKFDIWSAPSTDTLTNFFKFLSIAEPLGGLALIFGFLTQLASLGLALVMIGAIYYKIFVWKIAFMSGTTTGWEYDLMIFAACVSLMFTGAGKLALDKMLGKK